MKRFVSLVLAMFFLFSSVGHAASYGRIQVSMNNNKIDVKQVPIIMDGKEISTESPSFIREGRTMVPIRFVEANYGAEVIWEGETRSVIVNYNDDSVKLTIDSPIAIINGEKKILDKGSIPRLVTFDNKETKTMVPLSFLSEALGFEVGWDEVNKVPYINSKGKEDDEIKPEEPSNPESQVKPGIISSINVSKGSTDINKIMLESDKELIYETRFVKESLTFVLDIKEAKLLQKNTLDAPGLINIDDDFIKEIRYSQFSYSPDITRIAIDLKEKKLPSIVSKPDGTGLVISFENHGIKAITKEFLDEKEAIVLHGANYKNMNIIRLKNPERLVFDFLDTVLEGDPYADYHYDLGFIKGVRVSQFEADKNYSSSDQIVRVVLDIKDGVADPNVKIDSQDNKIIIYPEKSFWENISYEKIDKERHFIINSLLDTDYKVNYNNVTKTLEVRLPTESVELNDGLIIIKDSLLDGIRVERGKVETLLSLQFMKSIEYVKLSKDIDKKVHLVIKRNNNIKPEDRMIVIDPGHGGYQPGATSLTGKKEKDFNLLVSHKLNNALKALGYNTVMTMEEDQYLGLYDRPEIANKLNADIFISIHGNAFSNNPTISGIEVLYCPAYSSDMKEEDQHPLAKAVLDALLATTGAKSRGTIKRPNLVVLREAKMPAILVEAGFLTNPEEEKLLFTDEYQNKIVDGIVKGVENYFEID